MRRSNSSGWPVSSACTGASKPSVCADFGTSCTWPSVIMMTPASRSGGVLASALLRSVKRLVPDGRLAGGLGRVDPAHLQIAERRELGLQLAPDRRRLLGPAGDRLAGALVDDDDGDVGEALALLLPQRRVGERQQQRRQRQGAQQGAAAAAEQQQRHQHHRQHRTRPEQGPGTIGEKSIDQLLIALPVPLPLAGEGFGVRGSARRRMSATAPSRLTLSPRWGEDVRLVRQHHCPSLSSSAGTCTRSAL